MKKYMLAFLIIIPIMFLAWNMSDFAEESKITYNGTVEEDESYQTDIFHEADEKEIIISEESEVMDEESDIISSGWYKYFLEQQEYISNISNGQCSYEIIGEDECEITLYNKEHAKVYSEVCPLHHSWVETISDNILEIGISVGSPARYTFYFDTETAEISDTYFNAKVFGDQYIAYMDSDVIGADEITLTLTDIFEKGILHQEVVRNFSVCADPMSAVHSVEMVDDNSIRLEYCEGEDYTTVSEIIELEWTPMFDDEPVTVVTKKTIYNSDGSIDCWNEYEYDRAGNMTKDINYFGSDGNIWYGHKYEYDSKGKLIKDTYYGTDGDIDSWNEYEYDNAGNQTKRIWNDSNGKINVCWEKEYDSAGNETKRISYGYDGSVYKDEYEYDSVGNKTKWIGYDKDGNIDDWYEYEYDSSGNMTKDIRFHSDGSIWYWIEYEYDSAGNQIKMTSYSSDGSIESWEEYEYDSTGYETKYTIWDCEIGIKYWREYEYDGEDTGNRIKKIYRDSNGTISEDEYDSMGNHTKHILYDNDLIISGDEWEYDSMGNLTKYTYTTTYQGYTKHVEYEYKTIMVEG